MKNSSKIRGWRAPATSIEQIMAEVDNYSVNDCGKHGKKFEPAYKYFLLKLIQRYSASGVTDAKVKRGVSLEIGHNCKPLTASVFNSKEEALHYFRNTSRPMRNASHVAYSPTGNLDFGDTRIYTQREFIDILETCGLIRATKHAKDGTYKVAIQSYKFKDSDKKEKMFKTALASAGETSEQFLSRMFGKA